MESTNKTARPPLLTRSSILILCGVLIGAVSSHVVSGSVRDYALAGGVIGIIAFIAVDYVAYLQRQRRLSSAESKAADSHEQRLDRHLAE